MKIDHGNPAIRRAHAIVNRADDGFAFTDLTATDFGAVQSKFFRLFVPIKRDRMRLPTSLAPYRGLRHLANLSDSPLLAAHKLGGHWSDHNLAAICHVAACNLRCAYCYVDFQHLSGRDSFLASGKEVVVDFLRIRADLAARGQLLSILRISGGEPLLAPDLIVSIFDEFDRLGLDETVMLKVESNMTAFRYALEMASPETTQQLGARGGRLAIHVTLHPKPGSPDWARALCGLSDAIGLGLDVYPAIGGADWTKDEMETAFADLSAVHAQLPRRLAVRPFKLDYEVLQSRKGLRHYLDNGHESPSMIWEEILLERDGESYLAQPRHTIALDRTTT